MRGIGFMLAIIMVISAAAVCAQPPVEQPVFEQERTLFEDLVQADWDGEKDTVDSYKIFTIADDVGRDSTMVYERFKTTGFSWVCSGDSVAVYAVVMSGHCEGSDFDVAPIDTLVCDDEGFYSLQVQYRILEHIYVLFRGQAGNGHETQIVRGRINRDRF